MGKAKITIEFNGQKEVYETDIAIISLANEEGNLIGAKDIVITKSGNFTNILRVYSSLGGFISEALKGQLYGSYLEEERTKMVKHLIPKKTGD